MRESKVEDYFDSQVRLSGGDVRKVQWIGRNGAPDKLAGWPNGNSGFVELKRPRARPRSTSRANTRRCGRWACGLTSSPRSKKLTNT